MLDTTPNARVQAFLGNFDTALAAGDLDAAVGMFAEECYWRDLVAFTWNIKTMEGRDQVRDMLAHCLKRAKPSDWRVAEGETATEADGVLESWISFETEIARGYGLVRLKDGLIWTLLTTMAELKGHEEKAGFTRPLGARHGVNPGAKTWKELRDEEAEKLGVETQPYVLIVGGGQGAHRARRALEATRRADDHRREERARRQFLAQALQVALPARPRLVRPSALYRLPQELAGVLAQGQDRRLAGNVRQGDGAELLDQDDSQTRELRPGQEGMDGRRRSRRQGGHAAAQAARVRDRHVLEAGSAALQGHGDVPGRAASFIEPSRPRRLQGQESCRDRLEQFGARHLRGALRSRRRRDDGAALEHAYRALQLVDGVHSRSLFRTRRAGRDDHGQGRPRLRLPAVSHPERAPEAGLRQDPPG